jgi:hypothetical protein
VAYVTPLASPRAFLTLPFPRSSSRGPPSGPSLPHPEGPVQAALSRSTPCPEALRRVCRAGARGKSRDRQRGKLRGSEGEIARSSGKKGRLEFLSAVRVCEDTGGSRLHSPGASSKMLFICPILSFHIVHPLRRNMLLTNQTRPDYIKGLARRKRYAYHEHF